MDQAERFLPQAFGRPDPDLTWLRIVAATRRLDEEAGEINSSQDRAEEVEQKRLQRLRRSQEELAKMIDELINDCNKLEERWVAQQRVFHIKSLEKSATRLRNEIKKATLENWRQIQISFP